MQIRAIYTFGSPRVLSPEAAAYAETSLSPCRIFRHVRAGDPTCDVPAKELVVAGGSAFEAFDHVGLAAVLSESDEIAFGPEPWAQAKAGLRAGSGVGDPASVEAHYMSRYHAQIYEQFRRHPEPLSNGWNPAVALACARAARLVYKGAVREVLPVLGFQKARLVAGSGVEALLVLPQPRGDAPYGIVAFRTTRPPDLKDADLWRQALSDWQSQAETERQPWSPGTPGSVPALWLRELTEIEATLGDAIHRLLSGLPIVVTGHSKGAAQGLLWALRWCQEEQRYGPRHLAPPVVGPTPRRSSDLPWEPSSRPDEEWRRPLSYDEVGARIRALRRSRGLTQAALAHASDADPGLIYRVERGTHRVHLDTLFALLAELDVSLGEFFDEDMPEALTPADIRLAEDLRELSPPQRHSVLSLIRFKLGKGGH